MGLIGRALFVIVGISIGTFLLNHFVFGNTGDALPKSARVGEWRKAEVREACFMATDSPERDAMAPKMPAGQHRVSPADLRRTVEMTVALNCYVVTRTNAVCEPNNRAWIVDYIGKYYSKRDQMIATAREYGETEIRNVRQVWNSLRNQAIETALAGHIKNGRLTKADFGWTTPGPIQPLLEQHAGAADSCPSASQQTAKKS